MRKYWKFTAIIAVIVLSIGTFYVNAAFSAEQYPEFVIETQSGDAEEIKSLVFEGSYSDTSTMSYASTNVKIKAEGSTYNNQSFLDRVIGQPPTKIKELQKDYHSFMRGKNASINSFFEDNQYLVYADVNDLSSLTSREFKFDISLLNKEDDTTNSFTVEVPDDGELDYLVVEDVQYIKGSLYLITHNMKRDNESYYGEKHIYTINMANQKISSQEAIIQVPEEQENTNVDVEFIRTSPTKSNDQLIMIKTERQLIEDEESTREEVINQEVISYDLSTKKNEKINIPDFKIDQNQLSYFDGSKVYFMTLNGQELVVTPYSLADKQVGQSFRIPRTGEEGFAYAQMTTVKDGKIYVATSQMNSKINGDVIVADAQTGKTLFKGQLAFKDSSEEQGNFELYIHEMYVE